MADGLKAYWQSFGLSVRAVNCLMFIQMPDAQGLAIVGQKNFARRADAGDKTIDEIWDRVFPGHGLAPFKKFYWRSREARKHMQEIMRQEEMDARARRSFGRRDGGTAQESRSFADRDVEEMVHRISRRGAVPVAHNRGDALVQARSAGVSSSWACPSVAAVPPLNI